MPESYRWDLTSQRRESKLENLVEASPENTKAKALDCAVEAYLALVGGNEVMPRQGVVDELLQEANDRGGLEAEEIAEIIGADDRLPVEYEPARWSVGVDVE